MPHELLFRPVHFVGHLRKEGAAAVTFADIDAVTMQLELIKAVDAAHRSEDRDFDVNLVKLLPPQRNKPWVFESGCSSHLGHNLMQRNIFAEMSDAASKLPMLVKRDKRPALHGEGGGMGMAASFSIQRVLDALVGYLFQLSLVCVGQDKLVGSISQKGKGMIADDTRMVVVVDIARILIEQMLDGVMWVEHQHQRDDGKLAAGAGGEVSHPAMGILLDSGNELFHFAALDGLSRLRIHFAGILVGGVVGEIAADDEEILFREIGFQHLSHPLQFREIVGGDDDRHDGRHRFECPLQERQLHLQAMLTIVGFWPIGEHAVGLCQTLCSLSVYFHFA